MIWPSSRTLKWLLAYVGAIVLIFGLLGAYLVSKQDVLVSSLLGFFLPDEWISSGEVLLKILFERNPVVVMNVLLTFLLVVVPLITFPLKEGLSASYEVDLRAKDFTWTKPKEAPLLVQGIEELLMLVMYVSLSLLALRLSLIPSPACVLMGTILSQVVMLTAVAVDFIGPTLARHNISPTDIHRVLFFKHFLHSVFFGLVFVLPTYIMGMILVGMSPVTGFILMAIINVILLVYAVLFGTVAGTKLAEKNKGAKPKLARFFVWGLVIGLLVFNGVFFTVICKDLLHISPVLKCEWTLVPDTFKVERPSLEDPTLTMAFDVDVVNPTKRRAEVGDNTFVFEHGDVKLASASMPKFSVDPESTSRQHLEVEVKPSIEGAAAKAKGLLAVVKKEGLLKTVKDATVHTFDPTLYHVFLLLPTPVGDLTIKIK